MRQKWREVFYKGLVYVFCVTLVCLQSAYGYFGQQVPYLSNFVEHISPIIEYVETAHRLNCKYNTEFITDKKPKCNKYQVLGQGSYLLDSVVLEAYKQGKKRQIRIVISDDIVDILVPAFVKGKKILLSIDHHKNYKDISAWSCKTNLDSAMQMNRALRGVDKGAKSIVAKVRMPRMGRVRRVNYLRFCTYDPMPFKKGVKVHFKKIKVKKVKKVKQSQSSKNKNKKK